MSGSAQLQPSEMPGHNIEVKLTEYLDLDPMLVVAGSVTCVEAGMPGEVAVITWWMPEGAHLVCKATNVEAVRLGDGLVEYQARVPYADVEYLTQPRSGDPSL
jgi:hypothetical protein